MRIPVATYRIQINPDFGFADTAGVIAYLSRLGISDVYAAPVFRARRGSRHGYDIVDPNTLNAELGSEGDFRGLLAEVKRSGMGWIQDIVPNHMAIDGGNLMLMDILEKSTDSEFFHYFDIDWHYHPNAPENTLTLPFLAKPYDKCMARGEIRLLIDTEGIGVAYGDLRLPLRLATYRDVLGMAAAVREGERVSREIARLVGLFDDGAGGAARREMLERAKAEVLELYGSDAGFAEALSKAVQEANSTAGDLTETGVLHTLLRKQVFRLVQWRNGSAGINYRRFFNVNRLIAVRMELPEVFEHHHRLVAKWLGDGTIDGVRIDHVDGLYDAHGYLSRLRAMAPGAYIAAEKILSPDETLSPHWDVQGTTGYDFLNHLNGIFCMQPNAGAFETVYREFSRLADAYDDLVYENKRRIVETHFESAVDKLATMAGVLAKGIPELSPTSHEGLRQALTDLTACFPVYRTYIGPQSPHPADCRRIEEAVEEARRRIPEAGQDLEVLKRLLLPAPRDLEDADFAGRRLDFVRKLQQYTGPIMAKGFEDTVLYIYNRLLSLNEVGGEPRDFGMSLGDFHEFNGKRLVEWPHAMSTTSTHDTKRGEDVRARINVLSEIPDDFGRRIARWKELNEKHAVYVEGTRVPSPNDEYFLYQTLFGAYPFEEDARAAFLPRLQAYMRKAIREAKSLTSWAEPDRAYEEGLKRFTQAILDPSVSSDFLRDFTEFADRVHRYGVYNSLSQTLLKITSPGVPDFYQGAEVWDLSLVDPDNRRPVDFAGHDRLLGTLVDRMAEDPRGLLRDLLLHPEDGAVKLLVIHHGLAARAERIDVFKEGAYLPVDAEGELGGHIICFARRRDQDTALIIAPRFLTSVVEPHDLPIGPQVWKNTRLMLPEGFPTVWKDAISGAEILSEGSIWVGEVLADFPVALLLSCGVRS